MRNNTRASFSTRGELLRSCDIFYVQRQRLAQIAYLADARRQALRVSEQLDAVPESAKLDLRGATKNTHATHLLKHGNDADLRTYALLVGQSPIPRGHP